MWQVLCNVITLYSLHNLRVKIVTNLDPQFHTIELEFAELTLYISKWSVSNATLPVDIFY